MACLLYCVYMYVKPSLVLSVVIFSACVWNEVVVVTLGLQARRKPTGMCLHQMGGGLYDTGTDSGETPIL